MANVTNGKDMTVIVLDNDEASALADLLEEWTDPEQTKGWVLDELTNALLSCDPDDVIDIQFTDPTTSWDKPEPSWKDEPTSDYRFGRG